MKQGSNRISFVIILHILREGNAKLQLIGQTACSTGLFADSIENGKQDGGENGDHRDDDEQLYERKTWLTILWAHTHYTLLL